MMEYRENILFTGITEEEYRQMMECFMPQIATYKSGEQICSYDKKTDAVGIVKNGMVSIERTDISGARAVLETVTENGIFGGIFYRGCAGMEEISVHCCKDCEIMFIAYQNITKRCAKACEHHSRLVGNMLSLIAQRSAILSERVEVLSRRTIRGKLLAYFSISLSGRHTKRFALPFSYAMLADYLCVDRSAMMRELKKLKEEGVICTQHRRIELLQDAL